MKPITSKQRVKISLSHQEPDRVPYCEIWVNNQIISDVLGYPARAGVGSGSPHFEAIRAMIQGRKAHKSFMRAAINEHLTFCKKVGFDIAMLRIHHFIVGVHSKAYLGPNGLFDELEITETDERVFQIRHPSSFFSILKYDEQMGTIMETDDLISRGHLPELKRYIELIASRPINLTTPFIDALEAIKYGLESDNGKDLFILGTADTCYPMFTHYNPVFLEAMALEPEIIDRYMEVTTQGVLTFLRAQLEMGVDGVIGTNDLAFRSGLMFSVRHFRRFIAPYLKAIVDECHRYGVPYIKHLDGNINKIIPILIDEIGVDGIHAIEPSAAMDIFELKAQYGEKTSFWGNLDCGSLLTEGDPHLVDAEAKKLIETMKPGGGYGFSSSNAIHRGVPIENFMAMRDALKKYGAYQ